MSTFEDYVNVVFIPYLERQLSTCKQLDVIFDRYLKESLKASTREKRGKGVTRKVGATTKLPGNWLDFLRDDDNKTELFHFIADKISVFPFPPDKQVFVTYEENVLSSCGQQMPTCSHEESDTRIFVHAKHAAINGRRIIEVRTVDSDVIVISI